MNFTKGLAGFAAAVGVLMLLKNGAIPKLAGDAAKGASDLAEGTKSLAGIA